MFLVNIDRKEQTIQLYAKYNTVTLKPKDGVRVNSSNSLEVNYYKKFRSMNLVLMPDSNYFDLKGIKKEETVEVENKEEKIEEPVEKVEEPVEITDTEEKVEEPVEVEDKEEEIVLEENPEDLRGNAIYEYGFLTKKKCKTILENRDIEFDDSWTAKEAKKVVINSNPK